jgi:peptidoglycan/xylan/chitin deacetylase (PgdA/CDA1 family)
MNRFSGPARRSSRRRSLLSQLVVLVMAAAALAATAAPARAAGQTFVTLEFDNGAITQYTLGYQQALQPHGTKATFFVNSGTVAASGSFMTWSQLTTLANDGNDIGGKSVNATNLTTDPNPTAQVCNDRAAILQHGLTPVGFAYPGGVNNATVQGIVKSCQYGSARTAGGVSPGGAVEALPPANWFATKAYAPSAVTLANLQALVNGADSHGGGWAQVVIGRVCSQTLDSANYTSCSAASGHIELADLNAFLDWMANAGQPGGAPAGASLSRLSTVVASVDPGAPTTTIACNGAPCASTPYPDVVSVTLAPTDSGSGVSSTHYTVDGSDPTLSSPTYSGAFTVNGSSTSTTVKYRSWDNAGNAETVNMQVIQAPPDTTAPTTAISCNNAACSSTPYVASVSVALSATDTGGSGLAATYYTTDGSTPTTASPTYSGPFALTSPGTYDVRFFSTDHAGNAEQVQTQQVTVVPVTTEVSLTFDNGTVGQYNLAYLQALQPHGAHATFFVNTGNVGVSANIMTWAQLTTLAGDGNDIGGKTVNATNLTTDPNPTAQVCNDRAALVQHGLDPVGFAYPGGAFNATVKGIVHDCGYGVARTAGSLSPTGPRYAETLPPADWYATRAYAPSGQLSLANMKALVDGAAAHGGGWSQIVITRVCSQTAEPNGYSTCTTASGWIELDDLNSFLDWMAGAGQNGGAPAGASLATVRAAAIGADAIAPVTTALCNGTACDPGTYTSTVSVTLSSSDVGSAVASTHYTTDGSTPTLASPTYRKRIPVTSTTTLTYRSWDHADNAEPANVLVVNADLPPDVTAPTTTITCDGNPCTTDGYNGSTTVSLAADDGTGWGIDATYYTTDGSAPTTSSTAYDGSFTLSPGSYTVQFFSTDLAGNAEQVHSQALTVLPPRVVVTFTFDDGDANQYSLAYQHALRPHGMQGTFFINTGNLEGGPGSMTWADLAEMGRHGQDIGGHTLHHIDLTSSSYSQQQKVDEVCNDRQALIDHGFAATSFAYPFGSFNANAQSIVQGCGFTDARRTGGIAPSGPPYSETIPPNDPFATITWTAPTQTTSPIQLSDMQNAVTTAAAHGGGWVQFVTHEVCSQALDPSNYSTCLGTFRPTELDTLNAFMDWLQTSGQPGGAPPRTQVQTVTYVINGPDIQAPVTMLNCDGSACAAGAYNGSATVSFAASDTGGSGTAATYYTTDGSTPTASSPTFTLPFTISQTTTFNFFSVDNAGNAEAVKTQTVQVQPNADPIVGAAGDIACDPTAPAFNDGLGTATDCRAAHTAPLLNGVDAVLPLGDDQYECGGPAAFAQSYDPTWGVKKSITHPVPGDKDYATSGGTDCPTTPGAGYYQYFGAAAGDPSKGYYSYDLGQWHVIAINTAPCPTTASVCAAGSAQEQWLQQDLAANTSSCTLAYYQNPRFASTASGSGGDASYQAIWQDLYQGGVDVVLNGDRHWYERFTPLNASGQPDSAYGVREFIVGTGGAGLDTPGTPLATSEALNAATHGVLRLTLHNGSYSWAFVPDEGTFTDSGATACHTVPDHTAPTTTIACNGSPCAGWYQGSAQVALTATDNPGGAGVDKTYYTTDGSTPTTSSSVYAGPFPLASSSTVKYFSVDEAGNAEVVQSQAIQVDGIPPTTTIRCNNGVCSTGWYAASVSVTLSAADGTGESGVTATYYTTDGSTPSTSSTPYTGAFSVAQTSTVKFFSVDLAGNAEAVTSQSVQIDGIKPTTAITCDGTTCASTRYTSSVSVALTASDNADGAGVDKTHYTTNGSTPTTSSPVYAGPFTLASTATVKFFSVDLAGNTEAVQSQTIQVDGLAPTTTIRCNNATCSTGWYTSNVSITLTATDNSGGTGVAATYYTTDGSTPTTSSTRYTGAFNVTQTRTVKFFSVDVAGNAEAVNSQLVRIDGAPPTTTIACNGSACTNTTYTGSVSVTLTATDNAGGSGVSSTHYTTNGNTPTLSSPTYTGAFPVSATVTVRFRSWDVAGNVEGVKSQKINVIADAAPTARLTVSPSSGTAPLTVSADASASTDTDATPIASYTFTFGDGSPTVTQSQPTLTHTYTKSGMYTVTVTVRDTANLSSNATAKVTVKK